eukprot:178912_1
MADIIEDPDNSQCTFESGNVKSGSECEVACIGQFDLAVPLVNTLICDGDNWRPGMAHCIPRVKPTCPASLSGHNMKDIGVALTSNCTLTAEGTVAAGQECIVECLVDLDFLGEGNTMVCGQDGNWNPHGTACGDIGDAVFTALSCSSTLTALHMEISGGNGGSDCTLTLEKTVSDGSECKVACVGEFTLAVPSVDIRACGGEQWKAGGAHCIPKVTVADSAADNQFALNDGNQVNTFMLIGLGVCIPRCRVD